MRRLIVLVLTATGAALLAAPVGAKEEHELAGAVCGPVDCAPLDDERVARWLSVVLDGNQPAGGPPAAPASYYELRVGPGHGPIGWLVADRVGIAAMGPRAGEPSWYAPPRGVANAVREAARRVEPFSAPVLTEVHVDGTLAEQPARYLLLLAPLRDAVHEPRTSAPTISIVLVTEKPTPWTHPSSYVERAYSPGAHALFVDGEWKQVPPELAARIERVAAPAVAGTPAAPDAQPAIAARDGSPPWAAIAGAVAGLSTLVAVGFRLLRRGGGRRGAQPA